jgi:hypothetical protein
MRLARWTLSLACVVACTQTAVEGTEPSTVDAAVPANPDAAASNSAVDATPADAGLAEDAQPSDASAPQDASVSDAGAYALTANDITTLFLGRARLGPELAGLLSLSDGATHGALLPLTRFQDVLAKIDTGLPFRETFDQYNAWNIVALRLDPCAKDLAADATCRREIRLVAQPRVLSRSNTQGPFEDHALHLIYVLDDSAFRTAVEDLKAHALSFGTAAYRDTPLGVHPLIERDGNAGPYATALKAWMLKHVGDVRLRRVAVNISTSLVWFLRQFDVVGSTTVVSAHACSPNPPANNTWTFNPTTTSGNPTLPIPNCSNTTNNVVRTRTQTAFEALSATERDMLVREALELSRSDVRGTGQGDCVSCHVAARNLATWRGVGFLDANDGHPARTPLRPLPFAPQRSPKDAQNMRALGYFLAGPWVSLRTAVDTAESLKQLRASY